MSLSSLVCTSFHNSIKLWGAALSHDATLLLWPNCVTTTFVFIMTYNGPKSIFSNILLLEKEQLQNSECISWASQTLWIDSLLLEFGAFSQVSFAKKSCRITLFYPIHMCMELRGLAREDTGVHPLWAQKHGSVPNIQGNFFGWNLKHEN